jgi:2-iminobutanoate/2-iminopropanoate deaminase
LQVGIRSWLDASTLLVCGQRQRRGELRYMTKIAISTEAAPKAVGPYSQAVVAAGRFVFASGQIPLDPHTGRLIESEAIADHVQRVMENLKAVLSAAGSELQHVVKSTIYVIDMRDFPEVNRVYASYFDAVPPARATVQVSALPLGARVEIDMVALQP